MDLLSDIIIEPKLAPLKYRISASLIDFLILAIISFSVGHFWGESYTDNESYGFHVTGLPAFVLFLIDLSLIPIQEGLTGKTIGKRVVGIRVLREDFSEISVTRSIVRHLIDVVDMMFAVGLFVASFTLKKQRIGDLVAKTVVVID